MEKENKLDLRVVRTQRALANAMLALLERMSFAKITVNDLCAEGMVSRSAFYDHFNHKYALLQYCMELLKERIFLESEGKAPKERLRNVLSNIQANIKVFKNLTMTDLDVELVEMMRKVFHDDYESLLDECEQAGIVLQGPSELISVFYSSAITSSIIFWISKNMPYTIEELTDYLCGLLPQAIVREDVKS